MINVEIKATIEVHVHVHDDTPPGLAEALRKLTQDVKAHTEALAKTIQGTTPPPTP